MDTLIEALLTLARLQGRPESIEREPVDISELLAMIVEDAQFEAGIKGCRVHLQPCPPFIACVSGELLYRCFECDPQCRALHPSGHHGVGVGAYQHGWEPPHGAHHRPRAGRRR
jgi:hypothetical protein